MARIVCLDFQLVVHLQGREGRAQVWGCAGGGEGEAEELRRQRAAADGTVLAFHFVLVFTSNANFQSKVTKPKRQG